MSNTPLPVVVPPGAGRSVHAFGLELIFHLTGEQTGGRYVRATAIAPVGDPGPPLHYHENEDECFLVQEGRMSFYIDGEWNEVEPGTLVFVPKGVVHSLKNVGDTPARTLFSALPAGFEIFFTRCEAEFKKPGGPDMSRIVEIAGEHGIRFVQG
jgi:mannose-6-phosphate isomerase-like protein (cupin superfamily)